MTSKVKNKFLISGSNHFIEENIKKIIKNFDDPEVYRFYGDEMNSDDFFSFIFTLSLFNDVKIAIVLKSEKIGKLSEIVEKSLEAKDTVIIFAFNEIKRLKKLEKEFEIIAEPKKNYAYKPAIMDMFSSKGIKINGSTAEDIYNLCMKDLNIVKNEVEKVEIYLYGKKEQPSEKEILNLISFSKNETIFTFIDFFMARKKDNTLMVFDNILLSGENLNVLFFMLFKRIQNVFLFNINQSLVKQPPWMMNKIKSDTQFWDNNRLNNILSLISDIDYEIKIGRENLKNGFFRLISTL